MCGIGKPIDINVFIRVEWTKNPETLFPRLICEKIFYLNMIGLKEIISKTYIPQPKTPESRHISGLSNGY